MHEFIARHHREVEGTLSGFDRLVLFGPVWPEIDFSLDLASDFRGTLRAVSFPDGFRRYLQKNSVLLKDYSDHVAKVSRQLKESSLALARATERPIEYLGSSGKNKEQIARDVMARDHVEQGLICALTAIEPCWTFEIFRNRDEHLLELQSRQRKCLFIYQYWIHPIFGFMNARIQTWFPFRVQICVNGREWLRQELQRRHIAHVAVGNCLVAVENWTQAQQLLDQQLRTDWPTVLSNIAKDLNPAHEQIFARDPITYYWSAYQSEWAIDVVFRDETTLRKLYPRLVHHGMTTFASSDVMRFLGKRPLISGAVPGTFRGDIRSDLKRREEGVRIKHLLNGNSVKLYDKAFTSFGSVLRAETTIQNGEDLKVFRSKEGDPHGPKTWRILRRGVADLYRRAQLSRKAAERYLDAFASVEATETLEELIDRLSQPTLWRDRRVRALRPFADDKLLLNLISRAEFTITGLRNRDLQSLFFATPPRDAREQRRRSALISRKLRLLRAHGVISKITGTHRYQLTRSGRTIVTAVLTALRASVQQLTRFAA